MGVAPTRAATGQYGLSMIVGGFELMPLELAGLYATIAEDGAHQPLRLWAGDSPGEAQPIFGGGAAWLTHRVLVVERGAMQRSHFTGPVTLPVVP